MQSFTLPLLAAKQLAQALLPHVSRDDVTPVLGGIVLGGERFGQYAFASDRYTVGRYDLTNLFTDEPTGEVWVSREALSAVRALGPATLLHGKHAFPDYHVTFRTGQHKREWTTAVEVEYRPASGESDIHWMRVFGARGADGNFPPTDRLFETFIPGEVMRVGLGFEHLAKFRPLERNGMPLRITMPKPSTGNKAAPILVESGARFKGLIQPNLLFTGSNGESGFGPDIAMDNLKAEQEKAKAAPAEEPSNG